MAVSKPLIQVDASLLDCVVCLEQKKLHLLPCAHRCCQDCIGNLAGINGQFPCPACRRHVVVQRGGFPVCLLSEYLREQFNNASSNAQGSKCWSCKVKSVEARCRNCQEFICYRCALRRTCEKAPNRNQKHDYVDLEELSAKASSQLDDWKTKTKLEISALQRKIEYKKNVLETCENINKQSDSAEKIILIEQMCNVSVILASSNDEVIRSVSTENPCGPDDEEIGEILPASPDITPWTSPHSMRSIASMNYVINEN